MLILRLAAGIPSVAAMMLAANVASGQATSTGSGQAYPYKPLRILTSAAGGNNDVNARIVAQGISGPLGQSVIVENRGAVAAAELAARAAPDGYTLLMAATSFITGPLLQKMPYDTVRDFSPITVTASSVNLVVLHPSVPINTIAELIAAAKTKPGSLNYASGATGSSAHLATELFKAMAGVDIVRIPFKGDGPAINALIGGEVQLMFITAGSVMPHVKSGRLKAIAVTSALPSALVPGLPTVAAAGLPGYESVQASGLFVPIKTPAPVIKRLNEEIVRVLNRPEVKEIFFKMGSEPVGNTPEQFAAKIKSEIARMSKVIKDAGIKGD